MSKYPLLNTYRTLAVILAVIVVVVGIITAINAATATSFERTFDLGVFIATLLPFLGSAFALGVIAEFIQLGLSIENHVEHIRQATERQAAQFSRSEERAARAASSQTSAAQGSTYGSSTQYSALDSLVTAHIQAKVSTPIHSKPAAESESSGQLNSGQSMTVYGRTSDNTWLSISRIGKLWVNAADVEVIQGDVNLLSIMQPPD